MALTFNIGANERAAVRAVKNLGETLEDVSDALDDLARDGDKSLGKLEGGFKDLAKQAEKTDRSVEKVSDNGFRKAGTASTEFKSEALQNFSEVTSSFDGSMQSIGDLAQGTLGGIASSIPGIGLLGGAAAVGVGLITAELVNQNEQAEFLRERLSNAYLEAAQAGRDYIDAAQAVQEAQDLMFNPERAAEWKQIQADAKTLGLDVGVVIDANAGKGEAQREVQERINGLLQQAKDNYNETDSIIGNVGSSVLGIKNRWDEVIAVTDEEKARVEDLSSYSEEAYKRERDQIQKTRDASQARYEALAQQAAGGITIPVRVDDSEAYRALSRFQDRAAQGVRVPIGLGRTLE